MTHVALIIESMGGGGAQRVVAEVAADLLAHGHPVSLITFAEPDNDAVAVPSGVERLVVGAVERGHGPLGGIIANIRRICALRRVLRACPARVLAGFVGTTNLLLILAACGLGRRVVISERNDPARQSLGRLWNPLRRHLYRHADLVTANSTGALDTMAAWVPRDRLRLLPNPVRQAPGHSVAETSGQVILAVGRLHPQKAYDVLLPAFAAFHANHPGWRLMVLGDGALRPTLEAQAEALGIAASVDWRGHVTDPFPWYRRADIFVMPSRYEGSPNALLEALSCGVAAIVSDALPGALEHIRDNESGLVVPVGDIGALAAALARLADDEGLRTTLGTRAKDLPGLDRAQALACWRSALLERDHG